MKAIRYQEYGSPAVLEYKEVATPAPAANEVLLRVRAASVNPLDRHLMRGEPSVFRLMTGLSGPKDNRLGVDVAGQIEAVGSNVKQFAPGDEVFGAIRGAFAEYACGSPARLVAKPASVTYEQAAAVPIAGMTALQALRDYGRLQTGQKVLINGAAGGVGTFAVQIAKSFGAEVTAVCSARNVEMLRSIGADDVIDYTQHDFAANGRRYDLIVDCIGNRTWSENRRALNREGRYVMVGMKSFSRVLRTILAAPFASQSVALCRAKSRNEDLATLGKLIEAGKVTPVIDRRYRLRDLPAAIAYLEDGHVRGKVVITLQNNNNNKGEAS